VNTDFKSYYSFNNEHEHPKKIGHKWFMFDKAKGLLKKRTCPHVYLECFKYKKGVLKHNEFLQKFGE
jgi:hypothetical protein